MTVPNTFVGWFRSYICSTEQMVQLCRSTHSSGALDSLLVEIEQRQRFQQMFLNQMGASFYGR